MTVAELIEHLQAYPMDFEVVSDYHEFPIEVISADSELREIILS